MRGSMHYFFDKALKLPKQLENYLRSILKALSEVDQKHP